MAVNTDDTPKPAARNLDLDRPNPSRMFNYFVGGRLHYAIDRHFGNQVLAEMPGARDVCLQNLYFLRRVVRFGVAQGIRQFLDIGSGMPTEGDVHQTAQSAAPESRVVYVESEPVAVAHSELVLEGNEGAAMVNVDGSDASEVLDHPATRRLLDFDQPIMVLAASLVHYTPNERDPGSLITQYRDIIAPGGYLVLSSTTRERQSEDMLRAFALFQSSSNPVYLRSRDEIRALMAGLDLVEPGVVFTPEWRPDSPEDVWANPERAAILAAVGRKP